MVVGAKGNYLSGKLRSCAEVWPIQRGGGWRWGGLFICQTRLLHLSGPLLKSRAFESLMAMWKQKCFFSQFKPQKTQTINRPLGKIIFSESDIYLKGNAGRATDYLCDQKELFRCSVRKAFKSGHVQINMESGLKFKITHRWWGLMCVVTRCGSPCAHCRNINGVFNCFWLRSVGWVWVKPIRRLEETVKDCLRKRAMTFW